MHDLERWLKAQIKADRHGCDQWSGQGGTGRLYVQDLRAQVDAHSAILGEHRPTVIRALAVDNEDIAECAVCADWDEGISWAEGPKMPWPCTTVRMLALSYRHRHGYREEWLP